MEKAQTTLLMAGASAPFLYFGTILVASFFYPGYSQVRQFASELGAQGAPHPAIFNIGMMALGAAEIAGALGMFVALRRLPTNYIVSISSASVFILFGVSAIISGFFPLPDPRHNAFGLDWVILFGPPLLVVAAWKHRDMSRLKFYSIASGLAMGVMVVILMGVGGFVTRENVGAFQRLAALACYQWIGVANYALSRRSVYKEASTDGP